MRFLSAALVLGAMLSSPVAGAEAYTVDPGHTTLGFEVTHLGISRTVGRFSAFEGTVEITDGKLDSTTAKVSIDATSVFTNVEKRDEDLRSANFFNVGEFATLTFKSTGVKNVKGDSFDLVGDLTILGVTKEVTLAVSGLTKEVDDPWGGKRRGARASTTIKRSDFGMDYGLGMVGDDIEINIELEVMRTP